MRKLCRKCGKRKAYSEFYIRTKGTNGTKDGYYNVCKECFKEYSTDKSSRKPRPRTPRYRVVYDPCNSFSINSSFTRCEIDDMLREEYLAIGTTFLRNRDNTRHRVTVSEFSGELKFERMT